LIGDRRNLLLVAIGIVALVVAISLLVASSPRPTEGGFIFRTKQSNYIIGDTVEFYFTNARSDQVTLGNPAPWSIWRQTVDQWVLVYFPLAPQILWPVRPGETLNWTWIAENRTEQPTRIPVEAGEYRIHLFVGIDAEGIGMDLLAYFTLRERAP